MIAAGSRPVTVAGRGVGHFGLDQRIRYSYSEAVTDLRQYLRVIPPMAHGGQRGRDWSLTVSGATGWRQRTFQDPFGNLTIVVGVPIVSEAVEFAVHVDAELDPGAGPHLAAADRRYLQPTPLTAPDAAIADLARVDGPAGAATISERVHRAMTYEWGITGTHTTAAEALSGGRGVCQDYAHIMVAACRRAGLQARYVSGHLIGEGGSHAWVEVLRPDPAEPDMARVEGWDPTNNRRTDATYLTIAVGRDYSDVAPMSGTFEGEATGSLVVEKVLTT